MDGLFHSSRQWNVRDKRRAGRQKQLVVAAAALGGRFQKILLSSGISIGT